MGESTPDVREARRMLAKGICIAGVGETEQGIIKDRGSFQLLAEVTKITLDDASWLKLLDREARGGEAYFGSKLHQLNRRYAQFLTRTLADGITRGELRAELNPQMARDFLFGGLEHWVRNSVGRGRRNDPPALAREIVAMLLDGWAAPQPAKAAAPWQQLEARIARLESRSRPAARAKQPSQAS